MASFGTLLPWKQHNLFPFVLLNLWKIPAIRQFDSHKIRFLHQQSDSERAVRNKHGISWHGVLVAFEWLLQKHGPGLWLPAVSFCTQTDFGALRWSKTWSQLSVVKLAVTCNLINRQNLLLSTYTERLTPTRPPDQSPCDRSGPPEMPCVAHSSSGWPASQEVKNSMQSLAYHQFFFPSCKESAILFIL